MQEKKRWKTDYIPSCLRTQSYLEKWSWPWVEQRDKILGFALVAGAEAFGLGDNQIDERCDTLAAGPVSPK